MKKKLKSKARQLYDILLTVGDYYIAGCPLWLWCAFLAVTYYVFALMMAVVP